MGGPLARMIRPDERALAVSIDEVAGAGGQLTPGDYVDILLFLHNNPELCTASDICRYRALAKSNVSAAVERLRSRGVLTVSPAPDNRRQRLLGFAPDALPMVAVLADIQRCSLEPLFAGFTAQEQQTLQDYLRRMDANLLRELNKE